MAVVTMTMSLFVFLMGLCAGLVALARARIVPPELDCTHSSFNVDVDIAGSDDFYCPEFFAAKSCCHQDDLNYVWAKVEDILQFVSRVLNDQHQELDMVLPPDGTTCGDYHSRLFSSRVENYKRAREAVDKGIEIFQGAGLQFLCAACFVCSIPMKLGQIDDYIRRALLSIQDTMGAVWVDQHKADEAPSGDCEIPYLRFTAAGIPFPSWGRFEPDMTFAGDVNRTFEVWLDRLLSLLLELPSTLLFEVSVLQLVFFYSEKPDTDASWLLLSPTYGDEELMMRPEPQTGQLLHLNETCGAGPNRLILLLPQDLAESAIEQWSEALQEHAPSWSTLWVASSKAHVDALRKYIPSQGGSAASLLWRRFQARDSSNLLRALCGEEEKAWVADFASPRMGTEDAVASARLLQEIFDRPSRDQLRPNRWPAGIYPALPLPDVGAFPNSALMAYLQAHVDFRHRLRAGEAMPESRTLIYACTSVTYCGGHGDRLNGMLSAAVLAFLSGRQFFIDSQRPVPLALVLQPAALDWRMFGTIAALPVAFNMNDKIAEFEEDPDRILGSQASVIRIVSNQRLTPAALAARPQQAAALGLRRPRLHSDLFRLLFRPSAAFQRRLDLRELPKGPIIGLHFRAGDQMPKNWKDPPRHALEELNQFLDCAASLDERFEWVGTSHWMLFADTDIVTQLPRVQELRETGKLLWPSDPDSIVHLDRSPATITVRGLLRVWAEWWTLAFDVNALVLSHSGFGATALEIGAARPAFLGLGCIPADGSMG